MRTYEFMRTSRTANYTKSEISAIILVSFILLFCYFIISASANSFPDADHDGVPDKDEINVYHTDPYNQDTDGDGYSDFEELVHGYSPHLKGQIKLEDADTDKDGLSDRMELNFHTDLLDPDTDKDGYSDGEEIDSGYDPLNASTTLLSKRIEINTGAQQLNYFLGGVRLGTFIVSSGKAAMPTPKGHFNIANKSPKAWSSYGLWMPYWMALSGSRAGIHELPIWPSGYREGAEHLGIPVSHGCVRLGIGPAQFLYDWTPVGTPVFIY